MIGSGVTGVEFTHMFSALGSQVTLVVSRQQVLPIKDPEVAAVLEDEFLAAGVKLLKGARAIAIDRDGDKVFVAVRRRPRGRRLARVLVIGSIPNTDGIGLEAAGVDVDDARLRARQPPLPDERPAHLRARVTCRAGCRCRRLPRCRAARSPST